MCKSFDERDLTQFKKKLGQVPISCCKPKIVVTLSCENGQITIPLMGVTILRKPESGVIVHGYSFDMFAIPEPKKE
ncbi:hypothetical protein IC619_009875 [Hazenella sp. IB182353]|uniref:hypothetical protein n=1 Tax=Polycladospora coralii TaxID=2771432 RepID=UPI0017466AAB|nr:hypothetical protein [Polycladospora coralii]MBS7530797.1 hypothetical protein [Polycladospora coralii]